MLALLAKVAQFATPLGRLFQTIDNKVDNGTERERIKAGVVETVVNRKADLLAGRGWFFPLFFIAPLGFWFAAVCVYSVLWCQGCAYPQAWSIAALPPPLDTWAGWIVSSLFLVDGLAAAAKRVFR